MYVPESAPKCLVRPGEDRIWPHGAIATSSDLLGEGEEQYHASHADADTPCRAACQMMQAFRISSLLAACDALCPNQFASPWTGHDHLLIPR